VPRSVKMLTALAAALLLGATAAQAQSVQITPFVGYAFGGSVRDTVLEESRSFDAALDYGGTLSFPMSEHWRFELLYSRQATKLAGGLGSSFDVTIERYMGGFQEEKGEGNVRWFGTVWFGATRFVPGLGGYDSETKFGAGVGLGVKTFPAKNVGLRLEARGFYTLVKGEGGAFCANGTCLFAFSGTGLWQGDVSAGLILAF
jgi:opacity protein-like surface antigen